MRSRGRDGSELIVVDDLVKHLWSGSVEGEVFAVLDGARDDRIHKFLEDSDLERHCLYEEKAISDEVKRVAPYVVRLLPWSKHTRWLFEAGWGKSWGILLTTRVTSPELRQHLRRFLVVKDEKGHQLYFRYYDPRVLRQYLPTCTRAESEMVFGPVNRYWTESKDARSLVEFVPGAGGVKQTEFRIHRN
jgi:hypothetical protein